VKGRGYGEIKVTFRNMPEGCDKKKD